MLDRGQIGSSIVSVFYFFCFIALPVCCIAMPSLFKMLNLNGQGYGGVQSGCVEAAVKNILIVENTGN